MPSLQPGCGSARLGRMARSALRVLRLCSVFEPTAVDVPARFDPVGGMQTHTGELTRALDARGVRQTVVTTRPPGTPRWSRFAEHAIVFRFGLPVAACRQGYAVPAAFLLPRLARRVDLVHAHLGEDLAVVPLALAAARAGRVPLVLTMHTSLRHTLRMNGARSVLLHRIGGFWEGVGQRRAGVVLTLTARLRDLLVGEGVPADRVRVIPSGVNPALFDGALTDDVPILPRPWVVLVGRLHSQKGVDIAVRALAHLPDVRLVVAGDGPERARLTRLAAATGVADRVHFLGFVPHARVAALLRAADTAVLASRYEELGTALVEAMTVGTPVVAAEVGGIPELVTHGEHGLLVPPGDPVALADALGRVLTTPRLAASLAANARERVSDYRWDVLADRVLGVYRELACP